jgi:hypothetical protein
MRPYDELMSLPYQEFLVEVFRDGPTQCTWHTLCGWLEENFSDEQIAEMNAKLYIQLCLLTPDGAEEDPAADPLRERMDIFWYAGDTRLNEKAMLKTLSQGKTL